ncbi:putative membrane protein [Desulfuromonas soudanensis]|uniref:Putative membrane protein n=1 Tax=Desulfuromonas soudanensis TaxID=1603606 RepID=A0A0M3QFI3_9BACT|nr:DUF2254 domain-containing protein [Desulfuromonas soudanensis]ALC16279.1 putative membrane protein [Desulfuromonas soudanensis]
MKTKLVNFYEKLRSSYWFIPSVMAILAGILASFLVYLDLLNEDNRLIELSWIVLTGSAGARAILSTVAGSMITVTGIVFSITIVTLSLTSQQFGPRLLQNFMRDRGNQVVLGMVTSTYIYCLLVLRTVSENPSSPFVPHLSILVAVLLAILCVGVLIYFIHHVAESIQVTNIIAGVSRDLTSGIDRLFPEKISEALGPREAEHALGELLPEDFEARLQAVPARSSGFLQAVDLPGLLELAEKKDLVIRINHRIGHFIVAGAPLVEIYPGEATGDEDLPRTVNGHFITGHKRSPEQDIGFLVNELVEVASRALSPGINDPFTAISCINHLGIALCDLAQRVFPSLLKKDKENKVRVIVYPTTFEQIVDAAFNQIRQYGRPHAAVTIRLLENIRVILPFTRYPEQRDALLRQAALIERGSHEGLPEEADRHDVHERYLAIYQTVEESFGLTGGH